MLLQCISPRRGCWYSAYPGGGYWYSADPIEEMLLHCRSPWRRCGYSAHVIRGGAATLHVPLGELQEHNVLLGEQYYSYSIPWYSIGDGFGFSLYFVKPCKTRRRFIFIMCIGSARQGSVTLVSCTEKDPPCDAAVLSAPKGEKLNFGHGAHPFYLWSPFLMEPIYCRIYDMNMVAFLELCKRFQHRLRQTLNFGHYGSFLLSNL